MVATTKEIICVALDIGGTNTVCGFVNKDGNVLDRFVCKTKHEDSPEIFVKRICELIHQQTRLHNGRMILKCMGIAAPNGNCYSGALVDPPNLSWKGNVPLAALFHQAMALPVYLANDANAAAWGEKTYGLAKKCKDFVMITLGTGLGCGVVSNGKLLQGHQGFAGEYGHSTLIPNGRDCTCGRKGCLEQYVSATALSYTYTELCDDVKQNYLFSRSEKVFSARMIHQAALEGDDLALKAFQITADYFGLALSNLVTLCNPERIILFGGLSHAGSILLKPLTKAMEKNLWHIYKGKVTITLSGLKEDTAAILGIAALAWEETSDI